MNMEIQTVVHGITPDCDNLNDLLRYRAVNNPALPVYEFISDDGSTDVCTCAQLHSRAGAVAASLQEAGCKGQPVLIFQEPGLEYIDSFYGCILAGAIAVPVYPPLNDKGRILVDRLARLIECSAVLASERIRSISLKRSPEFLSSLRWITTESVAASDTPEQRASAPDDIALIQFTSGSTSDPKGVQLTHRNLMANSLCIRQRFEHSDESQGVIWLPPYHDMGLIGGILQPLYSGFPVTLMAPMTFIESPLRWLEWITRKQATTSGGPNFAYDLCVDRIPDEALPDLDLSSWKVAFTGSETISEKTLRRFHERFSSSGFRWESFFPCYGLAESTLFVSGGPAAKPPVFHPHPDSAANDSTNVVSCGVIADTTSARIVDPSTGEICAEQKPGEVWIRGESVSSGYYKDPENNRIRFNCKPKGETDAYYRTGDIGFLHEGQLYITGRMHDALNHRGRNIFTTDIEYELAGIHESAIPQGVAAFSLNGNEASQLCIVQEVRRSSDDVHAAIVQAIRSRVQSRFEINPVRILLAARGTIPKTTSGKVKRNRLTELISNPPRTIVHCVTEKENSRVNVSELSHEQLINAQPAQRKLLVMAFMKTFIANALETDPSMVDGSQHLDSLGIDSICLVDLKLELDKLVQDEIDVDDFMVNPTLSDLASIACAKLPEGDSTSIQTPSTTSAPPAVELSAPAEPAPEAPSGEAAPGPARSNAQGDLYAFRKDPFTFMEGLYRRYGGVVRFHLGETMLHLVTEWELVQRVHLHDNDAFLKGIVYDPQRNLMGNSVLTAEQAEWEPQRKAAIPPFMNRVMPAYLERIEQKVSLTIEEWGDAPAQRSITPSMKRIALGSVLDCFLNEPWGERAERLYQVIEHMDDYFQVPQERDHASRNANFRQDIESFNQIVDSILDDRLNQPDGGGLLAALRSQEPVLSELDERSFHSLVKDMTITVLIAGFDTTSTTMAWFLYCMATHPDIQEAVVEEVSQQGAESQLLKNSILETLRLYPPLWFLAREAARDIELGGYAIPKRSLVLTSPYIIHRNPWEWPHPAKFDPQRFADRNDSIMTIPSYLPFGMGQRACLGRHFAMVEMSRVLSRLLCAYRFEVESDSPLTLASTFTLRPVDDPVFNVLPRRNGNG